MDSAPVIFLSGPVLALWRSRILELKFKALIVLRDWNVPNATREYERTAATFAADAWIIGRISMEPYAGKARIPPRKSREPIAREDFVIAPLWPKFSTSAGATPDHLVNSKAEVVTSAAQNSTLAPSRLR